VKINGSATLDAPVVRVWDALRDPEVLVRTIPGCERLETVGEDAYKMTVTAGVASIKGTYVGEVALTDPRPPHFVVLKARGQGAPGMVDATIRVRLSEARSANGSGATRIDYDADATIGGMIGGVGQRMLATVAKRTAGEFFAEVNRVLAGSRPHAAPVAAGSGAAGAGAGVAGTGAVDAGGASTPAMAANGAPDGRSGVFVAPRAARSGDAAPADPRSLVAAFAVGGAVALTGVVVGWLLGRRGRR
jgi:carbon monoxide dehydrogenase subunit G